MSGFNWEELSDWAMIEDALMLIARINFNKIDPQIWHSWVIAEDSWCLTEQLECELRGL